MPLQSRVGNADRPPVGGVPREITPAEAVTIITQNNARQSEIAESVTGSGAVMMANGGEQRYDGFPQVPNPLERIINLSMSNRSSDRLHGPWDRS